MNRNLVIGFSLIINKFFGLTYNLYKKKDWNKSYGPDLTLGVELSQS